MWCLWGPAGSMIIWCIFALTLNGDQGACVYAGLVEVYIVSKKGVCVYMVTKMGSIRWPSSRASSSFLPFDRQGRPLPSTSCFPGHSLRALLQTITAASFSSTNSYWWCFSSFCSLSPSKKTRTHLSSNAPPTLDFLNIQVSPSLPSWLSTSPQSPSPLHPSPSKSPPQFPNFKSISVPTAQVDQTIALEKHNKDERDENDGNKEDADDIDDASAVSFEQRTNGEEDKSLFDIFPADPFLRVPLAVQIKKWYICSVHLFKFWYNKKNLFKFHYKAG